MSKALFYQYREDEYMKCSRCQESYHLDEIHYSGHPDHALCEHCHGDLHMFT